MSLTFPTVSLYPIGGGVPILKRAPLGPFDTPQPSPDPPYQPIPVYTTLPANQIIPDGPDPLWWRGNAFAVTIPGLPPVAGTGPNWERLLTWFLDRYAPSWQATILQTYGSRGYTHFTLSWPDSRSQGLSVADFVRLAQSVKAVVPYIHVQLVSKDFDPHNMTWAQAEPIIRPVLEALITARAVDHVSMWETDLTWQEEPGNLQGVIDGIAAICNAAPYPVYQWFHGSTGRTGWGPNPFNRRDWWPAQRGKLTGLLYQGCGWSGDGYPPVPPAPGGIWPAGDMQARACDSLTQFAEASQQNINGPFRFVYWEDCATQQFYQGACSEDIGDLRGYEALCSQLQGPDAVAVSGTGNGQRLPDGNSTLKHW